MPSKVVDKQPLTWVPRAQNVTGCPAGLEYLTELQSVKFKQAVQLIELVGWAAKNKYRLIHPDTGDYTKKLILSDLSQK